MIEPPILHSLANAVYGKIELRFAVTRVRVDFKSNIKFALASFPGTRKIRGLFYKRLGRRLSLH